MDTDRLTKLTELRQRGLITEAEYEDQKRRLLKPRRPRTRWTGWWWKVPALLFLLWLFWPRTSTGFPTCTASTTRELVRRAIEEGADSRLTRMKLLALDEIEEVSYDAKAPERYCTAVATLNAGERGITWRLYQRGGTLLIDVRGL
ncbi:SHOCT domain-containing protein [Methylobacterium oxalidis]|uniref:SHOCT domain-containing protein n=1 Tax=Methylobacterium oxalidis TaxID=944322 RepID=A0A512JCH0_9HYPH|nr:SHOCT domain-containing protein [Methylobacterium oxalidis]GEP07615.1 hypothetical protein MOX02_56530 [Methylobacterium oxalidis]GJE33454.1 hypothetical protein LDDCCGHA_3654 [Methylobacterium oxalidis]GLS66199.1 hypothetical protein GCM10007888_45810 [Methylobacterium oxalidis]